MYSRSQGPARPTPLIPPSTLPRAYMEDMYIVAMQGGCHKEGPAGVELEGQQGAGVSPEVGYKLPIDNIPDHDCAHKQ